MKIFAICLFIAISALAPEAAIGATQPDRELDKCLTEVEKLSSGQWLKDKDSSRAKTLCEAQAQFTKGQYARAAAALRKLADNETVPAMRAELYNKAGWALLRQKDDSGADEMFSAAISAAPEAYQHWLDRGIAATNGQHYWDALKDFDEAEKRAPQNTPGYADVMAYRAGAWLGVGNTEKAMVDASRSLAIIPDYTLAAETYKNAEIMRQMAPKIRSSDQK